MKTNEVYKITNIITNKIYIGITNQGSHIRYLHHLYESRIGEPSPIHKSIAKYGKENFILEIIDFADNYEDFIYLDEETNTTVNALPIEEISHSKINLDTKLTLSSSDKAGIARIQETLSSTIKNEITEEVKVLSAIKDLVATISGKVSAPSTVQPVYIPVETQQSPEVSLAQ